MKQLILLVFSATLLSASAQTPTWADDVACILYSHCTNCHNDNGVAPFSLMTYSDADYYAQDIQVATQSGYMPPWPPDPEYNSLAHERVLSEDEKAILEAWWLGGSQQGNLANAPTPPVYSNSNIVITDPDISVRMEDYTLGTMTDDEYRCFVMQPNTTQETWITGIEVLPGNSAIVHHVLVYQDTSNEAILADLADPDPGYTCFGGVGSIAAKLVALWVPGSDVYFTPPGMGLKLPAGANLVMQVHYPYGSDGQLDSTRVNFLTTTTPQRNLAIDPILEHFSSITNGPLIIPPDQIVTFHEEFQIPWPVTITAVGPHAHLLGKRMWSYAVTPSNDTIQLIDIPNWDFHWQGLYEFRQPIILPLGTVLHGYATYDNTAANPENPNDPPAWVFLGEATTDEMMLFFFAWTISNVGDEDIVIDTALHSAHHLDCETNFNVGIDESLSTLQELTIWPRPANDKIIVRTPWQGKSTLTLFDTRGKSTSIINISSGEQHVQLDRNLLPAGIYVAELVSEDGKNRRYGRVVLE